MFGRHRLRTPRREATLLLASVVGRLFSLAERSTPDEVVRRLTVFLASTASAVRETGGQVVRFVGDCSIAAWVYEPEGRPIDPAQLVRDLVRRLRREVAAGATTSAPDVRLRVGLAKGDCIVEEERGRIVRVVGHAWLRLHELPALPDPSGDTIVIDGSLAEDFAAAGLVDLGGGAFRLAGGGPSSPRST